MDFTMKDIDQEIIKFNYDGNFKEDDFYVSKVISKYLIY